MAKMSMRMIDMYVDMVTKEFDPIRRMLASVEGNLEEKVRRKIRKKLGIYKLHEEKLAITTRLGEIEEQLNKYESNHSHEKRNGSWKWFSKLDLLVEDDLKKSRHGVFAEVEEIQEDAIKQIKLSGITGDAKDVFDMLPIALVELEGKISKTKLLT